MRKKCILAKLICSRVKLSSPNVLDNISNASPLCSLRHIVWLRNTGLTFHSLLRHRADKYQHYSVTSVFFLVLFLTLLVFLLWGRPQFSSELFEAALGLTESTPSLSCNYLRNMNIMKARLNALFRLRSSPRFIQSTSACSTFQKFLREIFVVAPRPAPDATSRSLTFSWIKLLLKFSASRIMRCMLRIRHPEQTLLTIRAK